MHEITKNIKDILLKNGIKPTAQRIIIYEFLEENRIHPNVDRIYKKIHDEIPIISKTTIYNTLNLFMEKNLILGLTLSGTEMNYDINTIPHHHFYCVSCGKVFDIDISYPHEYNQKSFIEGHQIHEVHGYFKGLCENCKN